jgi:hypothetical protein
MPSSSAAPPRTTSTPPPKRECIYQGRHRFRHCGLFGDPHLKTFKNEYQTCRVRGAWPLIDNPYLGVQVTNEPVVEGSPATATTKVSVTNHSLYTELTHTSDSCQQQHSYDHCFDTAHWLKYVWYETYTMLLGQLYSCLQVIIKPTDYLLLVSSLRFESTVDIESKIIRYCSVTTVFV